MSSNFFDPIWEDKLTLPVKRVGDRWEFFFGGDIPAEEGTFGELTFSGARLLDDQFREHVSRETEFKVLEEGTQLLVALSDRSNRRVPVSQEPKIKPGKVPAGATRFETVTLGPAAPTRSQASLLPNDEAAPGGLFLRIKGLSKCEMRSSTVLLSEGPEKEAASLNHAFTILSRRYETHRISNTGNVYTRVFYQDSNGFWYPLADLRSGVQNTVERELVGKLWEQIEQKLGWRPIPPSEKSTPGRRRI